MARQRADHSVPEIVRLEEELSQVGVGPMEAVEVFLNFWAQNEYAAIMRADVR